jgi:hypothetical protein
MRGRLIRTTLRRGLLGLLLAGTLAAADAREYTVLVRAPHHDIREAVVSVDVTVPGGAAFVAVSRDATPVPSQARFDGDRAQVAWIVRDLKREETIRYQLSFEKQAPGAPAAPRAAPSVEGAQTRREPSSGVRVDRRGEDLEIRIDGELFTRYDTTTGPNKPYFYPLVGPGGRRLTRRYPIEKSEGESTDHPHHRGLWFTHGAVNGVDFWSEGATAGKTVHRHYERIESGPVYGAFRARTDWIAPDGKKVCEDVRDVRVYPLADGRLMDVDVTIRATNGPVVLGDTKEGAFGVRVADSMRVRGGGGHIETSAGKKDGDAWGKRAEWVDTYGPVDGATVGIALMDHPQNLRHPTWWHARDYGLFAANPFGIHDFEASQPAGAGDHTIPAGGALTLRYRLYLHRGSTSEARVAEVWAAYADPPTVEVLSGGRTR